VQDFEKLVDPELVDNEYIKAINKNFNPSKEEGEVPYNEQSRYNW
jgi:hypothetical protein